MISALVFHFVLDSDIDMCICAKESLPFFNVMGLGRVNK